MLFDGVHSKCKVVFAVSASFILLTCHHVLAADSDIVELANDVASDLQQWKSEIRDDPAVRNAHSQAAGLLIMLMVESRQLDTAQVLAHQLDREFEYWTVAHPVLLAGGKFDEAIEIGEKIVDVNPRMRGFVVADTFSAIATQQSIDEGFGYLDQLPSGIRWSNKIGLGVGLYAGRAALPTKWEYFRR